MKQIKKRSRQRRARDNTGPVFHEQRSRRSARVLRYLLGEVSRL